MTSSPTDSYGPPGQEVFGPYLVYERLGVGGMATVHRAKERGIEGFERIVALKRLLPHLAEDAAFVRSFVREAKLASMLQHANIVQLYELGRVGSIYFISMENIDGRDIRRILRQARKVSGPPNINVTLSLLIQICDALDYAHTRGDEHGEPLGLVHRDVSPSNLLVTRSGHIKVIDFGIAKAQSQQLRTQTGRVKGKLAYMAPEAISGHELDARSDIFSVGVIAHELLTARPLFASKNEYQTLINVQRSEVLPPSAFNQAVPPELDDIVLRALTRDPDQRYLAAAQMRDDLHAVRIRYHLSATNREVQTWCDWAFSLEAPGGNFSGPAVTDSLADISRSAVEIRPSHAGLPLPPAVEPPVESLYIPPPVRARRIDPDDAAEIAWGSLDNPRPEAVIVDGVPDRTPPVDAMARPVAPLSPRAIARVAESHANVPHAVPTLVGIPIPSASHSSPGPAHAGRRTLPQFAYPTEVAADDATARAPRTDAATFGATIVERSRHAPKVALAAGGSLVLAFAAVMLVGRDPEPVATAPVAVSADRAAMVKFIVEPADATIKIAGMAPHQGTPWTVPLDPGVVQIQVSREGHQAWETSIDLSPGETQTVRVGLAAGGGDATHASLELTSMPAGLAVVLDGRDTGQTTPWKTQLPAGTHTVQLRDAGGAVAWTHRWSAEEQTLYAFSPAISPSRRPDRAPRDRRAPVVPELVAAAGTSPDETPADVAEGIIPRGTAATPAPTADPASRSPASPLSAVAVVAPPAAPAVNALRPVPEAAASSDRANADRVAELPGARSRNTPASSDASSSAKPLVATPSKSPAFNPVTPSAKPLVPPPTVAPRPEPVASTPTATPMLVRNPPPPPKVVPPMAVKRVAGELPRLKTVVRPGQQLPTTLAAKICIATTGAVTSVQMLNLSGDLADSLSRGLRGWRYTPYLDGGQAIPVCFVHSFRIE